VEGKLTLAALLMTLARPAVQPGVVPHPHRGARYASDDHAELLNPPGIDISMPRRRQLRQSRFRIVAQGAEVRGGASEPTPAPG